MLSGRKIPPVRVGVVGVGHMGRYHVGAYSEIPNVQIVGVCDANPAPIRELAGQFGIEVHEDYRELFGKVDAVSVAVPTHLHYPVVKDFLEAGIHVLVEKPIASTLDEARDLFRIAGEKGLQLHIGHVERFNAAVLELRNIVDEPYLIESRRIGPFNGRITDAGVVLDLLIHDLDIVINLVGKPIADMQVLGRCIVSDHEDLVTVQIRFEGGCVAHFLASRVTEHKSRTLAITQKGAYVSLDYTDQEIDIHRQASSSYRLTSSELKYRQESFIERIFVHKQNPLKLELMHFLECALGIRERMTTIDGELSSLIAATNVIEELKRTGAI